MDISECERIVYGSSMTKFSQLADFENKYVVCTALACLCLCH